MQKKNKHKQYQDSVKDAFEQLCDDLITKAEYEVLIESATRKYINRCGLEYENDKK